MGDEDRLYELARAAQERAIKNARRKIRMPGKRPGIPAPEPVLSPAQRQGRRAEDRAARHLEQCGLAIVGYNLRCRAGEIDLVALDRGVLVFIEVRARRSHQYGGAAASVNRAKQQRLTRAALYFMPGLVQRHFGGRPPPCRFDVVTLGPEGLAWTRLAFDTSEPR